jgi:muramidase (phage lysozyme)
LDQSIEQQPPRPHSGPRPCLPPRCCRAARRRSWPALAQAGFIDPVSLPMWIGQGHPDASFGDAFTPSLTAVLEHHLPDAFGPDDGSHDPRFDRHDGGAGVDPGRGDTSQPPAAPVTVTLPAAFGLQPLAPVRQRGYAGRIADKPSAMVRPPNPMSSAQATEARGHAASRHPIDDLARRAELEAHLGNPYVRAFVSTIGDAEGAGYNTFYGGAKFGDYSRFPGYGHDNTASGRYQIMAATYDRLSAKLGLTDFSPKTQDLMAAQLLVEDRAMEPLLSGNADAALSGAPRTWASLPKGPNLPNRYPGQPYMPYNRVLSNLKHNLGQ